MVWIICMSNWNLYCLAQITPTVVIFEVYGLVTFFLHLFLWPLFGPLLISTTTSNIKCWLFCLSHKHEKLGNIKWKIIQILPHGPIIIVHEPKDIVFFTCSSRGHYIIYIFIGQFNWCPIIIDFEKNLLFSLFLCFLGNDKTILKTCFLIYKTPSFKDFLKYLKPSLV